MSNSDKNNPRCSAKYSWASSIFSVDSDWTLRMLRVAQRRKAERNFLCMISMVCTLGGLLFGYNMGVINGAIVFIKADLGLTSATVGLVTGSMVIGAAFGAFLGGHMCDRFGRFKVTLANGLCFTVGTLACALAPNLYFLIMARVLVGVAVGCASATVPMFLAELAPAEQRAQMVTREELMCCVGILCAFLADALLGTVWASDPHIWRWMMMLGIVPAVALLLGTWAVVPESPRWLIASDRQEEALQVLRTIRASESRARAELEEVQLAVLEDRKLHRDVQSVRQLLAERWVRRCLLVGLGVAACQQVTGVNVVMFYGTEILRESGMSGQVALLANISNGVISVLATLVGIWLLGRVGRRPLMITAQIGTLLVHLLIGLIELFMPDGLAKGLTVLALCVAFLICQQCSISPLTWLVLAEMFPLRIRGLGISLSAFLLWALTSAVGILFPIMADWIGIAPTFFAFSAMNLAAALFSLLWLPETRGKSLEQLEHQFRTEDWALLKQQGPNLSGEEQQHQQYNQQEDNPGANQPDTPIDHDHLHQPAERI